jgi:phosphatidylserine synthase
MSADHQLTIGPLSARYRWSFEMSTTEHLSGLLVVAGLLAVTVFALFEIGNGPVYVLSIVCVSFISILLVYGVRFDQISISSDKIQIDFSDGDTSDTESKD